MRRNKHKALEEFTDKRKIKRKSTNREKLVTLPSRFEVRCFDDCDGRLSIVRSIKRRYRQLKSDAGGEDSTQRDLLIQRACFLSVVLETQEVKAAEGGDIDLGQYTQGVNSLMGVLKSLGLEKRVKKAGSLQDYLRDGRDG